MRTLAKDMGKSMKFLQKELKSRKNADWFMDASAAKRAGLVDHIDMPRFLYMMENTKKSAKSVKK